MVGLVGLLGVGRLVVTEVAEVEPVRTQDCGLDEVDRDVRPGRWGGVGEGGVVVVVVRLFSTSGHCRPSANAGGTSAADRAPNW